MPADSTRAHSTRIHAKLELLIEVVPIWIDRKLSHGFSSCLPAARHCATALLTESPKQSERGQCQDRKRAAKPFSKSPPFDGLGRYADESSRAADRFGRRWHERKRQLICLSVRTPRLVHRHRYAAYVGIARIE